jgi:hypothetical protein
MGPMQRLRVSSWLNPTDVMVLSVKGDEKSPPLMTKDGQGRPVPVLNQNLLLLGQGVIDDMSMQRSINNDENMNVVWDPLVLGGFPGKKGDPVRQAFFQAAVDACHAKEMQCLLGYTMMNPQLPTSRFKSFNEWLAERAFPKLSPEEHARKVVKFLDDNVPACDGISFDIEGLSAGVVVNKKAPEKLKQQQIDRKEAVLKKMIDRYQLFLGALADELAKSKKIVGVATAGMTSDTEAAPGYTAEDGFRIHQFKLGQGHPNMLIRPMAYDYLKLNGKDDPATLKADRDATLAWHDKIIDYALSVLPAGQFQLGFKTIMARKRDGSPPDYGGFITDVSVIKKRCQDVLRPKNIGIIFFPTSASFWSECNAGLNAGAPAAGAAVKASQQASAQPAAAKDPAQVPLDEEGLYRMSSWRRVSPPPPVR